MTTMTTAIDNSFQQLLNARSSVGRYQPDSKISEAQIHQLIEMTSLSPSAYNLQNWQFIAVTTDAAKSCLRQQAYDQPQISDAAVTFIVCGTLNAHQQLSAALQPSVDAGIISEQVQTSWTEAATGSHQNNPQLQRDEAFRSASLAAMTLMLSAQSLGLASGAMSGFDPEGVSQAFDLSPDEIPVMLITVGQPAEKNWAQKRRKPVHEILRTV